MSASAGQSLRILRILHVEDDLNDAELIRRALARDALPCEVQAVATREEFLAALDAGDFSLILSDTSLPGLSGINVLEAARQRYPGIPFIFVSGDFGSDKDRESLTQAGATDCLLKSELARLVPTVQHALRDPGLPEHSDHSNHSNHSDRSVRYVRAMEWLVAVVQELSLAHDLPAVMKIVRRAARALTGADGAAFVLRDGDMCHYVDEDAIAPLWKGLRFPMSACISGWAMLNQKSAVIEDIYADPRIPHDAYRPTFVKSLVMAPIRTLNPIGAIGTYWATRHHPSAEEVKLLQALADTTAVALENVQMYSELEDRVKARSAELEAANKELEAFAYAVSHDLRAPVRHIEGFTQVLLEDYADRLDDSGKRHLMRIRGANERMGELIEALLALSRTTQAPLGRELIDLSTLVRELMSELQAEAPARQVEISIADGLQVRGDPRLLRVAMENLLSNAWKYTTHKASARIEFGAETADNGAISYFIRDNGAGFDMAQAGKLFGVFQRLHTEKEFPGTGVGLATVQRVIRRHGGRVWADAAPNAGATFHFTLA